MSSKAGHLSVLYIQRINIIIVDFIKIRRKNLVTKANLWLALCMLKFSPILRLNYADKYLLYS